MPKYMTYYYTNNDEYIFLCIIFSLISQFLSQITGNLLNFITSLSRNYLLNQSSSLSLPPPKMFVHCKSFGLFATYSILGITCCTCCLLHHPDIVFVHGLMPLRKVFHPVGVYILDCYIDTFQ